MQIIWQAKKRDYFATPTLFDPFPLRIRVSKSQTQNAREFGKQPCLGNLLDATDVAG